MVSKMVTTAFMGHVVTTKNNQNVLSCLLGSCIAVCMADRVNGVYGISHFMLPEGTKKNNTYGVYAIETLLQKMIKNGAAREHLEAKIYGGGQVVMECFLGIGQRNAQFAKSYLNDLKIPIMAYDVGGKYGRKITVYCDTWEVEVKRIYCNFQRTGFYRSKVG